MKELKYIVADKTIAFLLGVNNFINDETAMLELVKNAYDAGATELLIEFYDDSIAITDNGTGMNSYDIENNWMHVGESDKEYQISDVNNRMRIVAGAKGIGRFALARLGKRVEMLSCKKGCNGIIWKTDWEKTIAGEDPYDEIGTKIVISHLNQVWTLSKINQLCEYLSKAYIDDSMSIHVIHHKRDIKINNRYQDVSVGINCASSININYASENGQIHIEIKSDEFQSEAKTLCDNIDIENHECTLRAKDEIKSDEFSDISVDELTKKLKEIGDFSAELYFVNKPTSLDVEKFLYKHSSFPEAVERGVILYRNAFCITPYDGSRDWLELARRARKSPAAASHETGAWRVRDNQLSGWVFIDRENNKCLNDLSNRQGLEENIYFKLFIMLIQAGLAEFERYRQSIIRKINGKNKEDKSEKPLAESLITGSKKISELTRAESGQLIKEIKYYKNENKAAKKVQADTENRYKYDVRILNVLATIGLKSSAIAHEIKNGKSVIENNIEYVIKALKEYNMWDLLNSPDYTKREYKNVPNLLLKYDKHNKNIISFVDTMLSTIEKKQFEVNNILLNEKLYSITNRWENEYSWVNFDIIIPSDLTYNTSEDVLQVIFDNLILNSIQQNEKNKIKISIEVKKQNEGLSIRYRDNGKGLDKKYKDNPRRILEVHETTRRNGHGLGMWMVNNTVVLTGGQILSIMGDGGFFISILIGDKL